MPARIVCLYYFAGTFQWLSLFRRADRDVVWLIQSALLEKLVFDATESATPTRHRPASFALAVDFPGGFSGIPL